MKSFVVALIFLLVAFPTLAAWPIATGKVPAEALLTAPDGSFKFMPSLDQVRARAVRYGHNVATSVHITYDELGNVTAATLDKRTGDNSLDKAILAWAGLVKIQAAGAGYGDVPVKLALGE